MFEVMNGLARDGRRSRRGRARFALRVPWAFALAIGASGLAAEPQAPVPGSSPATGEGGVGASRLASVSVRDLELTMGGLDTCGVALAREQGARRVVSAFLLEFEEEGILHLTNRELRFGQEVSDSAFEAFSQAVEALAQEYLGVPIRRIGGVEYAQESGQERFPVAFHTTPSGATLFMDDRAICVTPCDLDLVAGEYHFGLSRPGYEEVDTTVTLAEPMDFHWSMERHRGWVSVVTEPGGLQVFLDDVPLGPSPVYRWETFPGLHSVEVRDPLYEPVGVSEFQLDANQVRTFEFVPELGSGVLRVDVVDRFGKTLVAPITIHGGENSMTPWRGRLPVGTHRFRVAGEEREVTLARNVVENVVVELGTFEGGVGTNTLGMFMVRIPAGEFRMGSPRNEPGREPDEDEHLVKLTRDFLMASTEVTQAQWRAIMGTDPSKSGGCENCPVESVTWLQAVEFLNLLSAREDLEPAYRVDESVVRWEPGAEGYRLPTEAEWEWAARAGVKATRPTEMDEKKLAREAWYMLNSSWQLHPVATVAPSAYGLFDMQGNVWEWCWDRYGPYPSGPVIDPRGPEEGDIRVGRGGSAYDSARQCRIARRGNRLPAGESNFSVGFRAARDLEP